MAALKWSEKEKLKGGEILWYVQSGGRRVYRTRVTVEIIGTYRRRQYTRTDGGGIVNGHPINYHSGFHFWDMSEAYAYALEAMRTSAEALRVRIVETEREAAAQARAAARE